MVFRHHGTGMILPQEQGFRADPTMMNTRDASHLEPRVAENFHYASQWVFEELDSKAAFMARGARIYEIVTHEASQGFSGCCSAAGRNLSRQSGGQKELPLGCAKVARKMDKENGQGLV